MSKKTITRADAEKLMPLVEEFNKLARFFLKIMNQKIDAREKRIKIMLDDFAVALPPSYGSINIQTIDMKETVVKRRGQLAYNQKMEWEKSLLPNKGIVI